MHRHPYLIDDKSLLAIDDDESEGIGMCFQNSFVLSNSISSPVDVEEENGKSDGVLVGHLIVPGLIFLWPGNVAVVDELGLISLLELAFENLLLGLEREVLVISAPIVEVVIAKADSPHQGSSCSQHIFIIHD
jgi:hypothetical protein